MLGAQKNKRMGSLLVCGEWGAVNEEEISGIDTGTLISNTQNGSVLIRDLENST